MEKEYVANTLGKCIQINKLIDDENNKYMSVSDKKAIKDVMLVVDVRPYPNNRLYLSVILPSEKFNRSLYLSKNQTCIIITNNTINKYLTNQKILQSVSINLNSLGADPEIFVVDKNDTIIPAFNFLPDKKRGNPFWDGFQAEFIIIPSHCLAYVVDYIQLGLQNVLRAAKKYDNKAKLTWKSVLDIPSNIMEQAKTEHLALGCAPSLNIYDTQVVKPDPSTLPFRFAGCHLHFGIGKIPENKLKNILTSLDILFGIISITLLQGMEDPRRRFYYGLAGEYRLPKHGLEYRTPSSAILAHPALFHLCYDITKLSINIGKSELLPTLGLTLRDEEIIDIINFYDVNAAKKYLNKHQNIIKIILQRLYYVNNISYKGNNKFYDKLFNLIIDGFINHIDISNMEKNWLLESEWISHSESVNCCVHKLELPDDLL